MNNELYPAHEAIREWQKYPSWPGSWNERIFTEYENLRNALQSQGWQSVDKLPSEDGRYWVYSQWDNGNGWLGYARYFAGHWECVDDGFHPDDDKITHWRPLPAPPTSGEGI